ncbi:C-C motif chemokine 4-like [Centropristis striata]|uniref:C-C motif chemokine 4-like n=1 Tax=Centropristis striata TaxID=184440 RepID=UPI0027E0185A|nr:C-C motif chemokine 4-like [Centropristis striata]
MTMMKNPVILVTCVVLFSSLAVLASQGAFGPDECCFSFISTKLPKDKVVSFKYTAKQCAVPGVLFTMMNGRELCADPSVQWVKNLIKTKERLLAN